MDKLKLVEKLQAKTNITYEEAKNALEKNEWDILDTMVYLEQRGKVERPSVSVFYSNQEKVNSNREDIGYTEDTEDSKSDGKNSFEGVFESVCKFIDKCNNIFLEIKRKEKVLLKIPLTVLIVLLFFGFWMIIPLMIVGLFFDIEFSLSTKVVNVDKVNNVLRDISEHVQNIKKKFKKELNND